MKDMKRSGKMRRSKRKVCAFCVDKAETIDYKDINRRFAKDICEL
jgi:small subunit ribosomal protein S18